MKSAGSINPCRHFYLSLDELLQTTMSAPPRKPLVPYPEIESIKTDRKNRRQSDSIQLYLPVHIAAEYARLTPSWSSPVEIAPINTPNPFGASCVLCTERTEELTTVQTMRIRCRVRYYYYIVMIYFIKIGRRPGRAEEIIVFFFHFLRTSSRIMYASQWRIMLILVVLYYTIIIVVRRCFSLVSAPIQPSACVIRVCFRAGAYTRTRMRYCCIRSMRVD